MTSDTRLDEKIQKLLSVFYINIRRASDGIEGYNMDDVYKGTNNAFESLISAEVNKARITKEQFEANLLDGDKVEDCGGAMLSAKDVWEVLSKLERLGK